MDVITSGMLDTIYHRGAEAARYDHADDLDLEVFVSAEDYSDADGQDILNTAGIDLTFTELSENDQDKILDSWDSGYDSVA